MYSRTGISWFRKLLAFARALAPRAVAAGPPKRRKSADEHEFFGRHLIASYVGCSPAALADHRALLRALREAIAASGATLLRESSYEFTPSGITAAMLLSESHACIHTYPERQACFVDLFTCGRSCSAERFHAVLRDYLCPAESHSRIVLRHAAGADEAPPDSDARLVEWAV